MNGKYRQRGLTLLELTVVLLIMIALGGLALPYVAGTGQTAACRATDATMSAIKEAIMGGPAGAGFYGDLLGQLPRDKAVADSYNLDALFIQGSWQDYNPKTGVGWRGPYLQGGGVAPAGLAASFTATDGVSATVHVAIAGSQILDAWGRPVVLQVPDTSSCDALTGLTATQPGYCARLVSAGPGDGLQSGDAEIDTPINDDPASTEPDNVRQRDDRVLYLKIAPPSNDLVNNDCD